MKQTIVHIEHDNAGIVAGTGRQTLDNLLKLILERMERIEAELQSVHSPTSGKQTGASGKPKSKSRCKSFKCWNCGGKGHVARELRLTQEAAGCGEAGKRETLGAKHARVNKRFMGLEKSLKRLYLRSQPVPRKNLLSTDRLMVYP